jgi:hypothetical protein
LKAGPALRKEWKSNLIIWLHRQRNPHPQLIAIIRNPQGIVQLCREDSGSSGSLFAHQQTTMVALIHLPCFISGLSTIDHVSVKRFP